MGALESVCHFTDGWGFRPDVALYESQGPLADVIIFWMWLLKERLSLISSPRYLEPPTDTRICPCSSYSLGTGVLARVICMTTHLLGLNSMSH